MATSQRARWISNSLTILVFSFLIFLFSGCYSSRISGEAASDSRQILTNAGRPGDNNANHSSHKSR